MFLLGTRVLTFFVMLIDGLGMLSMSPVSSSGKPLITRIIRLTRGRSDMDATAVLVWAHMTSSAVLGFCLFDGLA